jgi:hypothetical protein
LKDVLSGSVFSIHPRAGAADPACPARAARDRISSGGSRAPADSRGRRGAPRPRACKMQPSLAPRSDPRAHT